MNSSRLDTNGAYHFPPESPQNLHATREGGTSTSRRGQPPVQANVGGQEW